MAERNITSVDLLESVTNKTNAIVEENGTLNKVNLHNEFNTINTKIDNEVNTLSNNIAQLSNPNLLINSDFRNPVNQRGQTSYTSDSREYTVDRWRKEGGTFAINDGYCTLAKAGTGQAWYIQRLENKLKDNTYTLSIKLKSLSGTANVFVGSSENSFNDDIINTTEVQSFTFSGTISEVSVYVSNNSSINIEWIKLEQGSIATPFVPRPYTEELALCQRYYRKLSSWASSYPLRGDNNSVFIFLTGVMMRTNPTISALNAGSVPTLSYGGTASGMNPSSNNISSTVIGAHQRWDGVEIEFKRETEVVNNGSGVLTIACHLDAEIY